MTTQSGLGRPPMRLSISENDPGYDPRAIDAEVYLDGIKRDDVITADEIRGECIVYATDGLGRGYTPATKILRGHVRIVLDAP